MKTTAPVEIYGGNDAAISAQEYANQAATSAEEAAASALESAAAAAAAAGSALEVLSTLEFTTAPVLLADVSMTYNPGTQASVTEGSYVRVRKGGIVYQVQAAAASSYHVVTPGGVKLNVIPGVKGYNVWAWGALGDGVTNDSTAVTSAVTAGYTDSKPVYFPAGTFMVNLNLSGSNATWGSRIQWNGEGRSLTILKAFSNSSDAVRITSSDENTFLKFSGLQFHGNGGSANHAMRINANHFGVWEDCQFTNAWIGFRHENSFGTTFSNCQFGVSCSYGYYGVGSAGAYCGFHTFTDGCRFRGSKVAYMVDNLSAPSGDGAGNIHERSDWETVAGLAVYLRNQSAKPEQWRNCWFESNATSGTVDPSDLPSPSSTIGTLTIPASGVIIHSGTSSSNTYKKTRIVVEGGFPGADVLNDCEIVADRIYGAVTKSSANVEAVITTKQRLFDPYAASTAYGVIEAVTDRLDYYNALANSGAYDSSGFGALGVPKTALEYNTSQINRLVGARIDAAGVSGGFVFSSAGTAALDYTRGGILGRSYEITIANGESVDLVGTGSSGSISGFNDPTGMSFAIMHATTGDMSLDIERVVLPSSRSTIGSVKVRNEWKTYNFFTGAQLSRFAIKNNTGSSVTFYLTDLQGINGLNSGGTRARNHSLVVNHLTSNKLAAATSTIPIIVGRPAPYILAQSGNAQTVGAVTTEVVLATITVPGGVMGANGAVEIYTVWECNNNANLKSAYVRAGGTGGTLYQNFSLTTHNGLTRATFVSNQNSQSSQISDSPGGSNGIGSFTASNMTSTINTANAWDIVIAGQKAVAGDTLILKRYRVTVHYSA